MRINVCNFSVVPSDKYSVKVRHFARITSNISTNKLLRSLSERAKVAVSFVRTSRSYLSNSTPYTPISRERVAVEARLPARAGVLIPSPLSARTENRVSSILSIPHPPRMRIKSRRDRRSPEGGCRIRQRYF